MIEILLQIQSQTFLEPYWKKAELLLKEKTFQTTRQNKHFIYVVQKTSSITCIFKAKLGFPYELYTLLRRIFNTENTC